MAWFNFLKSEGYFDPEKNPEPVRVKGGVQIPYWEALRYLEKISVQISEGKENHLIPELIGIIENVSKNPKDNYYTWYAFIKILSNIPNDKIPHEILHFIPVWLSGNFDTMLQTSELCDKLLPKFLNDQPTQADIEKAEILLNYLLKVEKIVPQNNDWSGEGSSYHSRVYLQLFANKFEKGGLVPKIVQYCSSDLILQLGRTLKFLLLDYPNGIISFIKDGDCEYEIKIEIEYQNILISSKLINHELANKASILLNWESKNEDELKNELVSILKQQNINYTPSAENNVIFRQLKIALSRDLIALGFSSIRGLDDKYSAGENVLTVFSLIFRELLDEQAKQNPAKAIDILKTICFDSKYLIPFYKRISLYVICENWDTTKSLFFELIKNNDDLHIFSYSKYQKELFDLLCRNQHALVDNEIILIESIIEKGNQKEFEKQEGEEEYWKLGWYSALKDIDPFKKKNTLSFPKSLI